MRWTSSFPSRASRVGCAGLIAALLLASRAADAQDATPDAGAPHLVAPRLLQGTEPAYPAGETATSTVVLELTIDASGAVTGATVTTSGGPAFDGAALEAARTLAFAPATRDGAPIPATVPFHFDFAPAPAPAPAPPDAVQDIDVRGDRAPREVTRRSFDAEEILRMPGTNGDALHSLENMPGVARTSDISGDLVVRGSAPEDTAVFVDGTWIPVAFHFGGLDSVIPSEVLSRLDFYPGNFSPEYGRQMGGIVDLGVRSPRKDRIGGLLQFDLIDGRTVVEGPLTSSTRVLVAARRSWVDAWLGSALHAAGDSNVAAPVYYDYQALLEQDLGSRVTARVFFFGADDRLSLLNPSAGSGDPTGAGDLGVADAFWRIQGRLDAHVSDDVRWVNMVSWGKNIQRAQFGNDNANVDYGILNARSDLRLTLSRAATIVAGADVEWGQYDVSLLIPPQPADGQAAGPAFGSPKVVQHGTGTLSRPGAYLLADVAPVERLHLLPGVRLDGSDDTHQWTIDPRFTARFDLIGGPLRTTLKGGVGVFHQPPQPNESLAPFGTPTVRANVARHDSLGVEQQLTRDIDLSVEGFHKDLRDLVVQVNAPGSGSGSSYVNTGSGNVWGAELLLKWRAGDGPFFGSLAYTLSRSVRRNDPSLPYTVFDFDQTHVLSVVGSYRLGRGWTLGARWRYATGDPYTPYTGGAEDFDAGAYAPIQSPRLDSARLGAFNALDLRVDKTWTFPAWKLTAYLDVRNVYNRQNPEAVTYNYNDSQSSSFSGLPILPMLGLRGEL
jgi:TonB family protein